MAQAKAGTYAEPENEKPFFFTISGAPRRKQDLTRGYQ